MNLIDARTLVIDGDNHLEQARLLSDATLEAHQEQEPDADLFVLPYLIAWRKEEVIGFGPHPGYVSGSGYFPIGIPDRVEVDVRIYEDV